MTQAPDLKKLRRIYWLCDAVVEKHRSVAQRLTKLGYAVQFFSNLEAMTKEISKLRAPIIIVGDEASPVLVSKAVMQLSIMPEVQGVRLILSVSKQNSEISLKAACASFRDLIPLDLPEKVWIERFLYATARRPMALPEPALQVSLSQIASVAVPARLAWVGDYRLLFETRMRPPTGSHFVISGAFVEALGLKRLAIEIEECRRNNLIYRFSDAILARWKVPEAHHEAAKQLLAKMRQTDFGPRIKVFLGMQDADLRGHFVNELDPLRFELNVALQKQSLVDEPKYFCPQIVFIEDKLCLGPDLDRIKQMFDVLPPEVPVYIVGSRVALKTVQDLDPVRKVVMLPKVPARLTEAIFTRYLPPSSRKNISTEESSVHLTPDHPFSMVELHVPARLTKLHPSSVQLALPYQVGTFGLVRIDAPDLKKAIGFAPYAKVTLGYDNYRVNAGAFPFVVEGYFCDVIASSQKRLGQLLVQQVNEHFGEPKVVAFDQAASVPEKIVSGFASAASASADMSSRPFIPPPPTNISPLHVAKETQPFVDDEFELKPTFKDTTIAIDDFSTVTMKATRIVASSMLSQGMKNFMVFVFVTASLLWLLYYFLIAIGPVYRHSGGEYTDSLRKFAPDKFEKDESKP